MTAAVPDVNSYFTPLHYILYLGIIFVVAIGWYLRDLTNKVNTNLLAIIAKADGSGEPILVPRIGGSISIRNRNNNSTRMWPINKLCTTTLPYPLGGVLPNFLRKDIRICFVSEEDWEPLLNWSAYQTNVASPDVIEMIKSIAASFPEADKTKRDTLMNYASKLSSGSTREMIASPAVLGNLMNEKASELATTVQKDFVDIIDRFKSIMTHLGRLVTPQMFFIGIGALAIVVSIMGFMVFKQSSDIATIKTGLGLDQKPVQITPQPK